MAEAKDVNAFRPPLHSHPNTCMQFFCFLDNRGQEPRLFRRKAFRVVLIEHTGTKRVDPVGTVNIPNGQVGIFKGRHGHGRVIKSRWGFRQRGHPIQWPPLRGS
jgi:hypothetical protein